MQPDLEERLERIDQPKQVNNENDTLYITNVDTDCSEDTYDSVRVSERFRDQESGRVVTQFKELNYHFNHADGFQVRWSGTPFDIKPGETKKMPRFLGEHFAYHLCNHMLDKQGSNARNDPLKRPAMLKRIIVGTEPFFADVTDSIGAALNKQVESLNVDKPVSDLGDGLIVDHNGAKGQELNETTQEAYDPLRRVDKDPVEPLEDVIARVGPDVETDNANVPEDWKEHTKPELIKTIRDMDPSYKFPTKPTKAQLVSILKKTAGV